jgi:hypothetical protein
MRFSACEKFDAILRAWDARSAGTAQAFYIAFVLDLSGLGLYNPATSRQAVSFPVSERTTFHLAGDAAK